MFNRQRLAFASVGAIAIAALIVAIVAMNEARRARIFHEATLSAVQPDASVLHGEGGLRMGDTPPGPNPGQSGYCYVSNGPNAWPSWQACPGLSDGGVLPISTYGSLLVGNSAGGWQRFPTSSPNDGGTIVGLATWPLDAGAFPTLEGLAVDAAQATSGAILYYFCPPGDGGAQNGACEWYSLGPGTAGQVLETTPGSVPPVAWVSFPTANPDASPGYWGGSIVYTCLEQHGHRSVRCGHG